MVRGEGILVLEGNCLWLQGSRALAFFQAEFQFHDSPGSRNRSAAKGRLHIDEWSFAVTNVIISPPFPQAAMFFGIAAGLKWLFFWVKRGYIELSRPVEVRFSGWPF